MACIILTPKLLEIAKELNISNGRVVTLASLTNKMSDWTTDDIKLELKKQNDSKFAQFTPMSGVVYTDVLPDIPLIRFDDSNNIINISVPKFNLVSVIQDYLKSIIPDVSSDLLDQLPELLNKPDANKLFLNYLTTGIIVCNATGQNLNKALEGAIKLYKGYLDYIKDVLPNWKPFFKKLSKEQLNQFAKFFNSYSTETLDTLFLLPISLDIKIGITNSVRGNGEYLTRDMMVWIVNNLKEEYRQSLSSFYPKTKEEVSQVGKEEVKDNTIGSHILKHQGNWSRQEAQNNPRILYVFTDNTDRDSGSELIPADSWYSKKYGEGHHFPTMTAAVIRGLENARPISTQRYYHQGAKGTTGRWTDVNVEDFSKIIESELRDIIDAWNSGNYDTIMFPDGDGLFNTSISNITKQRTPALYKTLSDLLIKYGMGTLVPQELQLQQTQQAPVRSFSILQAQEVLLQATESLPQESERPTIPMPLVRTQINKVTSNDNPRVIFHNTFTALEKNEAVTALVTDFIITINSMIRELRLRALQEGRTALVEILTNLDRKGRKEWIISHIAGIDTSLNPNSLDILSTMLLNYVKYLTDESYRQSDLKNFGQDFVDAKINWLLKITGYNPDLGKIDDNNHNFEILMQDAAIGIEKSENIILDFDFKTVEESTNQEITQIDNDTDPEEEGRDGWMIKTREVDPRLTLSEIVKITLSTIPKGKERDILGRPKLLSADYVHAVLINELSKMAYAEDFVKNDSGKISFPTLEKLSVKYPWVETLIRKLKSQPELASQFYTDFRKDFISYIEAILVIETDENGNEILDENNNPKIKTITKKLNESVAVDATMSEVSNNYDLGTALTDTPVYSAGSINEANRKANNQKLDDLYGRVANNTLTYDDEADRKVIFKQLNELLRSIGFNTKESDLEKLYKEATFTDNILTIFDKLSIILGNNISPKAHLITFFEDAYTSIAEIVGSVSELMNVQSFRAGDKTFYSYSVPNYVNTLFKRLTDNVDENRRKRYIEELFGQYEFFYDHDNNRWRSGWMELFANNKAVREHFKIENMNVMDIFVNGEKETVSYKDWDESMMAEAFIVQYYSYPTQAKENIQYARYNIPIYSDSPVVNFVTMPRYTGENFREVILEKFVDVVELELVRIKDIADRQSKLSEGTLTKDELIDNYDSQGNKFLFFPKLNNIPGFYETINNLYKEELVDLARDKIRKAISDIMEEGAKEYRLQTNISKELLQAQGLNITNSDLLKEALDEYYWNQAYATSQIIQLTVTDLAFCKDLTDFQKRYKEVYAAGNKLNIFSEYGKPKERVLYLKDEEIPSIVLPQIENVLAQAVQEKRITKLDKEAILSKFKKVNVADALAFRSMKSMRSILDMLGLWTPLMQEVMDRFESDKWTVSDFNIVWQTIKPFMFTLITDTTGGTKRKVPTLHKNSEFLLLAMHSLIINSNKKQSEILRALNKFVDDNDIDVVMFESAVKTGGQSKVQITDGMSYDEVMKALDDSKKISTTIKEFDYEDYVIQLPTPEHLIDHISIFGSLFRNLVVSDISDNAVFTLPGKGKVNKHELLKLYQSAIVENLLEDYKKIKNKFATIEDLLKAILDTIKGNPKYGTDIVEALLIVDGRFSIPLWNPSTTDKLQEVVNSFFKNTITKLYIKGGNAILVSNFGFVNELKCVYKTDANGKEHLAGVECYLPAYSKQFYEIFTKKDKDGNDYIDIDSLPDDLKLAVGYRIPTEDKYSMVPLIIKGFLPQANGSAIMLPADITVHAGSDFDVDKLFLILPEFDVVTDWYALENKILENTGFKKWGRDNVKMTIEMIKNGHIQFSEDTPEMAIYDYYSEHKKEFIKVIKLKYDYNKDVKDNSKALRNNLLLDIARSVLTNSDTVDKFVNPGSFDKLKRAARVSEIADNVELLHSWKTKMLATLPSQIENEPKENKKKELEAKLERVKQLADDDNSIASALLDPSLLTDNDLKEIVSSETRDPLSPLTFFYYHKLNMTGGALIGMYANNTTIFSKFLNEDLSVSRMGLTFDITLNGVKFNKFDGIVSPHGERVSKNCAEFSAASVDNVKDPVLAKLMQNKDTAKITAVMLRLGMSVEEIGLLFTQPVIKTWVEILGTGYKDSFSDLVSSLALNEEVSIYLKNILENTFDTEILNTNLTSKDLLNFKIKLQNDKFLNLILGRISTKDFSKDDIELLKGLLKILLLMDRLYTVSLQLSLVTQVSRADSPNGAMAISIAGNIIQYIKVQNLKILMLLDDWMINGVDIYNDNITENLSEDELRKAILNSRFPILLAFYSLGIDFGKFIMRDKSGNPYFIQHTIDAMDALLYVSNISKYDVIDEDTANKFFRDFIKYELSELPMFGGEDFNTNRDFYLTLYPRRFEKLKTTYPLLNNIGIIRKIKNGKYGLEFQKSARLTPAMRDSFMRDFEDLLNGNEIELQLALDLFAYSYFKDGLYFGPNSFGNFFSTNFLLSIPQFVNGLRNINIRDILKFVEQFIINNTKILPKFPKFDKKVGDAQAFIGYIPGTNKTKVRLRNEYVYNKNLGDIQPYFVLKVKDDETGRTYYYIWLAVERESSSTTIYLKLPAPDVSIGGKRYNKNMSALELAYFRVNPKTKEVYELTEYETPLDYIRETTEKDFVKPEPKQDSADKYDSNTNENKTDFC